MVINTEENKMKTQNQTKGNPFRAYLERKGDSRSYEDFSFDRVKDRVRGKKRTPNALDTAQRLANNWEEMNSEGRHYLIPLCNLEDPLETMIDFRLKDYKGSFLSGIPDSLKRNRLKNLADEGSDPVYQKLESFRKSFLGEMAEWFGDRETAKNALGAVYSAYDRMIKRTMKQDEYEFLANASYNQFKEKVLEGKGLNAPTS